MYDVEFCDREYNARASIPDHLLIFSRWDARSRLVRVEEKRDGRFAGEFSYGDHDAEKLDLFLPTEPNAPILVFIHGGYWRSMDKKDFSFLAPAYLDRGIGLAIPNYSLAPAATLEQIVMQVVAVLAWLWRAGPRLGYDRRRIVVAGHSAGGHLTGMAMSAIWPDYAPDLPADLVKAGIMLSGLFDLEPLRHTTFLQPVLQLDAQRAATMSPSLLPQATQAPYITAVGALESSEFHRQSKLLHQAWPSTLNRHLSVDGTHHLSVCDAFGNPDNELFVATKALIDSL